MTGPAVGVAVLLSRTAVIAHVQFVQFCGDSTSVAYTVMPTAASALKG
jgi:hypothetical protein